MKRAIYPLLLLLSFVSIAVCCVFSLYFGRRTGLIDNISVAVPSVILSLIISFIISLFLAKTLAKKISAPLENVVDALSAEDFNKLNDYKYYEIDKMMKSIRELLQKMSVSKQNLIFEREKLDYILSNMKEGFVLIDENKKILLCNSSAKNIFDYKNPNPPENLLVLARDPEINAAVDNALKNRQSSIIEATINSFNINIYVSPVVNNQAERGEIGATIFLVDITVERALIESKRDFFSNASHELKTPITSIIGFIEMLNNDLIKSDDEKSKVLNRIEIEAKRMSGLINDILTISNLETGGRADKNVSFDFRDVILDACASVSPILDNSAIEIITELCDSEIVINANKRQIYEMTVNLIENAVKYNRPNGKVFIKLKLNRKNALLSVEDTGIGIPEKYQARVFERFYRVDYGRDKKIGGTGLGLSIVKHIVNIHKGEITLKSKEEQGTIIEISLPVI